MPVRPRHLAAAAIAAPLGLAPATVLAAGFYLQEQGVTGLGRAYAGEAAIASDASTIYFNPAGMTRLESAEFQAGAHLLFPRSSTRNNGSSFTNANGQTLPVDGSEGDNPYDPTPLPNFYWAEPQSDRVWLGFGLGTHFGLKGEYDDDFFARYDSLETDLQVLNLQPSIAVQISDRVSIGGGIDVQYADATLRAAIPDPLGPDPTLDGEYRLEGDSWDVGYNLGVLIELADTTRLGLHYRSGVTHTLKGTARVAMPENGPPLTGPVVATGEAELKLPDIASAALSHRFTDRWTGLLQYTWFNWSNFDEIAVESANPLAEQELAQNYRNSYALAAGAEYELNPDWTLRGGVQYDRTPTRDSHRSTRTPDGDRTWLSLGASWHPSERLSLDLGYSYVHVSSEDLELTREFDTGTVEYSGSTRGRVNILSAGLRYRY